MAVAVVHGLEAVEVDHQHRQLFAVAARAAHQRVHGVVQCGAVVQARQQIARGQALDAQFGLQQRVA